MRGSLYAVAIGMLVSFGVLGCDGAGGAAVARGGAQAVSGGQADHAEHAHDEHPGGEHAHGEHAGEHHHGDGMEDHDRVPYSKPPLLTHPTQLVGKPMPSVALNGTRGESSTLGVVDGKPTVFLMWSTWCQACMHETRALTDWAKSREDTRFVPINVNGIVGGPPEVDKVADVAAQLGLAAPVWITDADNLSPMGVRTCPTTFIVDAQGKVLAAREGFQGVEDMNRWLEQGLGAM